MSTMRRPPRPGNDAVDAAVPSTILRRRAAAAVARRRRQLVADLLAGALIAVVGLFVGFGLAPVGLVALVAIAVCLVSYAGGGLRRMRSTAEPAQPWAGSARVSAPAPTSPPCPPADGPHNEHPLLGGGTDGNEQLTAMTGAVLLVGLAVLGVTILRIGQLISVHLFVGLMLIGPVALKMASTGYRFARYYTHDRAYHQKGPPPPLLRLIAPVVVVSTVVVFASGLVLLLEGPADRGSWALIHKASFFVWLAFTGLHVLVHLPQMHAAIRRRGGGDGRAQLVGQGGGYAGRLISLAGVLVGGLVLALVLLPEFGAWTGAHALIHHDH